MTTPATPSDPLNEALRVIARHIERHSAETIEECARDAEFKASALEQCTTPETLCRVMHLAMTWDALMDHLQWTDEQKLSCREHVTRFAQHDFDTLAKLRRRRRQIN